MEKTWVDLTLIIEQLRVSDSLEAASETLKSFLGQFDIRLMSVKFADSWDQCPAIRPLSGYPHCIGEVCVKLQSQGGCPFTKEAISRLEPFELNDIDRSKYASPLDNKFFMTLEQECLHDILIVPIKIKRALALYTMDLSSAKFNTITKSSVYEIFEAATREFVSQFPAISTLFEQTHFSKIEGQILAMQCLGFSAERIVAETELSELTIKHILKNAAEKIGAKNMEQLIYRAMRLNELGPYLTDYGKPRPLLH